MLLIVLMVVSSTFAHRGPGYCPANDKHKTLAYERMEAREFNRDNRTFVGKVLHTVSFGLIGRRKPTGLECFK